MFDEQSLDVACMLALHQALFFFFFPHSCMLCNMDKFHKVWGLSCSVIVCAIDVSIDKVSCCIVEDMRLRKRMRRKIRRKRMQTSIIMCQKKRHPRKRQLNGRESGSAWIRASLWMSTAHHGGLWQRGLRWMWDYSQMTWIPTRTLRSRKRCT